MTKVLWLGRPFLANFFSAIQGVQVVHIAGPQDARLLEEHRDATFILAMNADNEEQAWRNDILAQAGALGIPRCFWNIEDPNGYQYFVQNLAQPVYDFVFTTDRHCIQRYMTQSYHYHSPPPFKVLWLPLAACPTYHVPVPLAPDAADLVLVAQDYLYWPARRAAADHMVKPLLQHGFSLKLFCPEDGWVREPEIRACRVGGENYTENCAQHYAHGRVALALNCQCGNGLEPRHFANTSMTSMRTFEVLACGKAMLAFPSTAYEQLGFRNGEHFLWELGHVNTVLAAKKLLGDEGFRNQLAEQGRQFVFQHHTYQHRLERILRAIAGEANPTEWQ